MADWTLLRPWCLLLLQLPGLLLYWHWRQHHTGQTFIRQSILRYLRGQQAESSRRVALWWLLPWGLAVLALAGPAAAAPDSTPSSGVFKTGQEVHDLCVSKDDADVSACDYFIMAVHDAIKLYGDTKMADSNLCPPEGVTALELRNTVLAYWNGRTTSLKYSAVSSIRNALFQKYGCSE